MGRPILLARASSATRCCRTRLQPTTWSSMTKFSSLLCAASILKRTATSPTMTLLVCERWYAAAEHGVELLTKGREGTTSRVGSSVWRADSKVGSKGVRLGKESIAHVSRMADAFL